MTWYNEEHRHSRIRFVTPTSGIGAKIKRCWRNGMRCIRRPERDINQVEWQDARLDTDRCRDAES